MHASGRVDAQTCVDASRRAACILGAAAAASQRLAPHLLPPLPPHCTCNTSQVIFSVFCYCLHHFLEYFPLAKRCKRSTNYIKILETKVKIMLKSIILSVSKQTADFQSDLVRLCNWQIYCFKEAQSIEVSIGIDQTITIGMATNPQKVWKVIPM